MVAKSDADADASAAGTSTAQDAVTASSRDVRAVSDFAKDTGTDERFQITTADRADSFHNNEKRTYDLHQTTDLATTLQAQKHSAELDAQVVRNSEATLLHNSKLNALEIEFKAAEHNQRLRHADFQVTALAAVTQQMIDSIADKVSDKVCASMSSSK